EDRLRLARCTRRLTNLLQERGVRHLRQAPAAVQQVEQIEHLDLDSKGVPSWARQPLSERHAEAGHPRAPAAVPRHDVPALREQAWGRRDKTLKRLLLHRYLVWRAGKPNLVWVERGVWHVNGVVQGSTVRVQVPGTGRPLSCGIGERRA